MLSLPINVAATLCVGVALLTGCGSQPAAHQPSSAQAGPTRQSASNPSRTSFTGEAPRGDQVLPHLAGYSYVTAPPGFAGLKAAFDGMGMTVSVTVTGVRDGNGRVAAVLLVAQYTPKLTQFMDKAPVSTVLAGGARLTSALLPGGATTVTLIDNGHPVRLLLSRSADIAFAYVRGGRLIEVFGQAPGQVKSFMSAYLNTV